MRYSNIVKIQREDKIRAQLAAEKLKEEELEKRRGTREFIVGYLKNEISYMIQDKRNKYEGGFHDAYRNKLKHFSMDVYNAYIHDTEEKLKLKLQRYKDITRYTYYIYCKYNRKKLPIELLDLIVN